MSLMMVVLKRLLPVLAHEIGHYKLKHTLKGMILSVIQTGTMFYLVSLFIGNPVLSKALGASDGKSNQLRVTLYMNGVIV